METVPGVAKKEAALFVRRDGGTTLVVNDILANVRQPHGIGAHVMAQVLGFGVDRPSMPRAAKWFFVKDGKALGAAFRKWSDEPDLERTLSATAMSSPTNRAKCWSGLRKISGHSRKFLDCGASAKLLYGILCNRSNAWGSYVQ